MFCPLMSYRNQYVSKKDCESSLCMFGTKDGKCLFVQTMQKYIENHIALSDIEEQITENSKTMIEANIKSAFGGW